MTTKLVTCIYNNIHGTMYGGRLNRNDTYMYSLNSISETQTPITCFTSANDINDLLAYFVDYKKKTNISFKLNELNQSPFHHKILNIKNNNCEYKNNSWESRCPHIMYGKFIWLLSEIDKCHDNDYVYWIDAGLSHGGILPRKFTNSFIQEKDYPPVIHNRYYKEFMNRHENIFNNEFINKINSYSDNKFLLICCTNPQHLESRNNENPCGVFPIGGLFGGLVSVIKPILLQCLELVHHFLNNNIIVQEEVILEIVLCKNKQLFKTYTFDTWYHDDWGDQYKNMNCFYKFFEDLKCI